MAVQLEPVFRGAGAGALGTVAMTAWQELAGRLRSAASGADGEESAGGADQGAADGPRDPWEDAPVPAQVARRAAKGLFGSDIPPERIPLVTNAMHWAYGTGWGVPYGLLARSAPAVNRLGAGALFGIAVWTMSYTQLVPMGLYEPPWRYPAKELVLDLSYHLVYGVGTGLGFGLLERAARRPARSDRRARRLEGLRSISPVATWSAPEGGRGCAVSSLSQG